MADDKDRKQSPHYIPELDPDNDSETTPAMTFFMLLLFPEAWFSVGIGGAPVAVGFLRDELPGWVRALLILGGVALSAFLVFLFIRTNNPRD